MNGAAHKYFNMSPPPALSSWLNKNNSLEVQRRKQVRIQHEDTHQSI